jgi:hypothetical protein
VGGGLKEGGGGKGGEMTKTLYAHMNKIKFKKELLKKRKRKIYPKVWKHKRLRIAKAILSKKSNAGNTQLQTILQSHSNKNSIVLAPKQT